MSVRLLILLLIVVFSVSVFGQKTADNKVSAPIADVNFCDLIEKPDDYAGKTVRIRATFQLSAEASKIFCSDCLDVRGSQVKFADVFEKNTKKIYRKRLKEKAISNVIFVGRFYSGEFGTNKEYASQFLVESAENAEILSDKSGNLTIRMQAKTFCQKND